MDQFNEVVIKFLVEFLLALLVGFLPILGAKLHQVAGAAYQSYVANTSAEQRATIDAIVRMAVMAAEQTGLADQLKATGATKKNEALGTAQAALLHRGINLDVTELDSRIEAMVLAEFNRQKSATLVAQPAPGQ